MKKIVVMNKKNAIFKIKIVVQTNTKIVMVATYRNLKAGVYKIQILKEKKEKAIPTVKVMWTKFRGEGEKIN